MAVLNVIKIGNSRGVIIPSHILKALDSDKIEIFEKDGDYTLKPAKSAREGWEQAAKEANKLEDDELLMDFSNKFDNEEWEW